LIFCFQVVLFWFFTQERLFFFLAQNCVNN